MRLDPPHGDRRGHRGQPARAGGGRHAPLEQAGRGLRPPRAHLLHRGLPQGAGLDAGRVGRDAAPRQDRRDLPQVPRRLMPADAPYTDLPLTHLVDTVAFCDPAGRKRLELKRVRARAAIVVVSQDALGRVFVMHTWADRASGGQITDHIFRVQEAHHPRTFGIEANAMQTLFGDMVAREAQFKMRRVPLLPVIQPTNVDKDWRIRTALQPIIGWDRLFLQPDHYELRTELTTFPMNPLKDLVDALASA